MRDLWIQTEGAFATWVADLDPLRGRPSDLRAVVRSILAAGELHQVFTPVELPAVGYHRGRGVDLDTLLAAAWDQRQTVDLFACTGAAMMPGADGSSTVEAAVAWYGPDEQPRARPVTNLGAVLRALEPCPGIIPDGFTANLPPVRITGPALVYDARGRAPIGSSARRPATIRIALHSDIWFPFVFGSAHPAADHQRMFDNRELARLHTPRLAAFLGAVAGTVETVGGRWSVDFDETGGDAGRWVEVHGIDLDAPPPRSMPAAALAAPWC